MVAAAQNHPQAGRIVCDIERTSPLAVSALAQCYTGFVLDKLGKYGAMSPRISALLPGMKVCGTAVTVLGADVSVRRMAIDLAKPGDVLVVAAGGVEDRACFGEYTARQMAARGLAGIIIDGATRDAADIRRVGFPTFVRAVTPRNFSYPLAEMGAVNVQVVCGGATVAPGDVILGDDDGVVAVPRMLAEAMAATIVSEMNADTEKRRGNLEKPFDLADTLVERGYVFERSGSRA